MVVTASRTPEKKIDANADVAVVTAKEIEQKHFDDVAQAVAFLASPQADYITGQELHVNGGMFMA